MNSHGKDESLEKIQIDLAQRSFWNIGYFCAGFLFWVFVGVIGAYQPLPVAKIYWLVGTFCIFPIAVAASKIVGADPFTKGNKFGELIGNTHMSVISLSLPIIFASFLYFPQGMLLVMAIAYCIDFYVMSWAFGTPLFGVHAAIRTILVSLIWFIFPEWQIIGIPIVVASAYFITIILIPILRKKWLIKKLNN